MSAMPPWTSDSGVEKMATRLTLPSSRIGRDLPELGLVGGLRAGRGASGAGGQVRDREVQVGHRTCDVGSEKITGDRPSVPSPTDSSVTREFDSTLTCATTVSMSSA
jgi:hypothetical protein